MSQPLTKAAVLVEQLDTVVKVAQVVLLVAAVTLVPEVVEVDQVVLAERPLLLQLGALAVLVLQMQLQDPP